jgi:hypothetical protein
VGASASVRAVTAGGDPGKNVCDRV